MSVVNEYIAPAPTRHLPQMLMATTIVAVLPLASSLALRAWGVISSGWLSVALAIVLSLGASAAGSAYWRKHGAGEVLFGELLLWGWIRRWRQERELASATRLLQLVNPGVAEALTVERREHLLRQLAGALEGQDVYLNGHSRRVACHATMIARGMGLPNDEVARVRAAAAVHDVGKLLTPKEILNKPGRLTDAEFDVIKRHPVDGAEMVDALGDPELTRIVRHHHERLDGAGYPDGLCGGEIPIGARIIAVADTFDAITSARPYREAALHQKAIDILRKEAGAQLDPDAVRCFLAYYSGNRPTVVWALVTSTVRRVVAWLTGDPAAAATISAGKVAAATAATAAIGVAAGAAPVPVVHPLRPLPVASIHHVAAGGNARALARSGALHASISVTAPASTTAAPPSPAVRSRGAHTRTADTTTSRRRPAHPPSHRGAKHPNHAAANPASGSGTGAGAPSSAGTPSSSSNSSTPSATSSTNATAPSSTNQIVPSSTNAVAPSSTSHTAPSSTSSTPSSSTSSSSSSHAPQNSSAGGSASRPTSTNPAGHVNHASNTGNAARNGQPPHSSPPGHSGSSQGNGNAGGHNSQGNGGDHSNAGGNGNGDGNGNGKANAQPGAPAPHPVSAPPPPTPPAQPTPPAPPAPPAQGPGPGPGSDGPNPTNNGPNPSDPGPDHGPGHGHGHS